ncbi:MAG TPA: hypothetical protein VEJ63_24035 [Planctomycetota bacterium]|nr:hypothetical protein [Planctomycetota bacterium]
MKAHVRQVLMYIYAMTPSIYGEVISLSMRAAGKYAPEEVQAEPLFPYGNVAAAMAEGWQVVHFPDQRAAFDDREIDVLGYEFILQKLETSES